MDTGAVEQYPETSKGDADSSPDAGTPASSTPVEDGDVEISDLDSELEPDELVPTYLQRKGWLYELDASLAESRNVNSSKERNASRRQQKLPRSVQKLLDQLRRIEADALFDQGEADVKWIPMRNRIAQELAATKRADTMRATQATQARPATQPEEETISDEPPINMAASGDLLDDEADAAVLGDIFSATPEDAKVMSPTGGAEKTFVRDFGKPSGMPPVRILEDTLRARSVPCASQLLLRLMTRAETLMSDSPSSSCRPTRSSLDMR